MSRLSTHVLDAVHGTPAQGVEVVLTDAEGTPIGSGATDSDGRIPDVAGEIGAGVYRIRFDTGAWFTANDVEGFYPEITICFVITDPTRHHHVPVLLSPFAYSTYRGS